MPLYTVRDKETGDIYDLPVMSWADFQKLLAEAQGKYEQVILDPAMVKVN